MQLLLNRKVFTDISTIGHLFIDGKYRYCTLEDKDRHLTSTMSAADIAKIKVYGKTAIPTGIYKIIIAYSPKHGCRVPCLQNVPGYGNVEIHWGNSAADTLGCILVGLSPGIDWISQSKVAFDALMAILQAVPVTEEIYITIT